MHHTVLATVITQSQMHVQIKHSLAHLQNLIPTLAGIKWYMQNKPAKVGIKSCRCAREHFVCTCVWLWVITLANTG